MKSRALTKHINGVEIKAVFHPNGIVNFYESGRNPGQAAYNTHTSEWIKKHREFGGRFKAALKAAFLD